MMQKVVKDYNELVHTNELKALEWRVKGLEQQKREMLASEVCLRSTQLRARWDALMTCTAQLAGGALEGWRVCRESVAAARWM